MNKSIKLLALAVVAIIIVTPLISSVKAASWQTVNNDPNLRSSSAWSPQVATWPGTQPLGSSGYTPPSNSFAWTMRDMRGYSNNYWGNTEFVQGYKPIWGTQPYGQPFNHVLLTTLMSLTATAKLAGTPSANNAANVYIDLWCEFSRNVGDWQYNNMEIIIYLGEYGPSQQTPPGTFFTSTNGDGTHDWYFAGYRVPSNIGYSYATNQIAVSNIITFEANRYHITNDDLAHGAVVGLTFGTEVSNSYLSADWNYVNFQQFV